MEREFHASVGDESLADEKYIYIPAKIKPCPICGLKDALFITTKESYEELFKKNNGACLSMDCKRCNLRMAVYDHLEDDPSYEYMKGALIGKWNTRKEATDESEEN